MKKNEYNLLPDNTYEILNSMSEDEKNKINLKLLLDKYYKYIFNIKEITSKKNKQFKSYKVDNDEAKNYSDGCDLSRMGNFYQHKTEKIIKKLKTKDIKQEILLKAKLWDKIIIGFGEPTVENASMKLNHITGIPFIPASTIKGAFRKYLREFFIKQSSSEENKVEEDIKKIFGSNDNIGKIVFLDSYPCEGKFNLKWDIISTHYNDYYTQENKFPTDDQNPNVIKFPVIEKAKFGFAVIYNKEIDPIISSYSNNSSNNLEDLFKEFLNKTALGSKKAVGYGHFEGIEKWIINV